MLWWILIYFWVRASTLLIVWFELDINCYVLFEIVAAVLGRLKLWFLNSSFVCKNVNLLILVGVLIEFLLSEVSCLSTLAPSLLLILLFLD